MLPISTAPPRPEALPLIPENIPNSLTKSDQFMVWDWELRESKSGGWSWTKPPLRIDGRGKGKSTDPMGWGSFRQALHARQSRRLAGIGFALAADDPFAFGDVDDCRDPETGEIADWAKPLLARFAHSYQEVSPSGTGVKIIVRGRLPGSHNRWRLGEDPLAYVEWFSERKYTTLTGHRLDGVGTDVEDAQDELDALYAECFPPKPEKEPIAIRTNQATFGPGHLSDADVVRIASGASNGAKFRSLYFDGQTGEYADDESRADEALACHLVFYCQDRAQVERIFNQSALGQREKWTKRAGYRELTIQKAIDFVGARFAPKPRPQLEIVANGHQPTPAPAPKPLPPVEPRFVVPPEIAFRGWFGEYRDLMSPTTEAPDAFHLGSSLVLAGMMLGRRAWTYQGNRLFGNLYVVLVGPTGQARKDTAMNRALGAATPPDDAMTGKPEKPPFHTMFDVTSSEGIIAELAMNPSTLIYMTELSILLMRGRRQSTSTLLTTLIKLWDAPDRMDLRTKNEPIVAHNPLLSILTATTPDTLAEDIQPSDLASGFANRFLFFGGEGIGPKANPPRVDKAKRFVLMNSLRDAFSVYLETDIDLDAAAQAYWADWYDAYYRWDLNNDEERQMVQRLGANIHKIALLYAATESKKAISLDHLKSAIAVVEWSWAYVRRELTHWGQEQDAKIADKIESVLRRKGPTHKRMLQQALGQRLGPGTFIRVLEAMVKGGRLDLDPQTGVTSLGTGGEEVCLDHV